MLVKLDNIQGFRGTHTYGIYDLITIINSKHNGVGKTTLYDCLKFLCDERLVDKDEKQYFLNLDADSGLFEVEVEGVSYGFALMRERPPVFYRRIDGEDAETSETNFPTVGQDIGVLIINGVIINIFSKEVNLFSGSDGKEDYKLIKALTTHEPTELALSGLVNSQESLKADLSRLKLEKTGIDSQVANLPFYKGVDMLEHLINDSFYVKLEDGLEYTKELMSRLRPISNQFVNSNLLGKLDSFDQLLWQVKEVKEWDLNITPLSNLTDLNNLLEQLSPMNNLKFNVDLINTLDNFESNLNYLKPVTSKDSLNTETLESMNNLIITLEQIKGIDNSSYHLDTLSKITETSVHLGKMITTLNNIDRLNNKIAELRATMAPQRISCPIREEVYLVDGNCCY